MSMVEWSYSVNGVDWIVIYWALL